MEESVSPYIPGTQIMWAYDSTSLGLLKECARKFYYQQILGLRPKGESVHLVFGGHFAKALERYHKFMALQPDHDEALEHVIGLLLTESEDLFESLHDKKTRPNLIRSVIWYIDKYKDDPCKTVILDNGQPAVELSFKFGTGHNLAGVDYIYCGHLDRLVDFEGDRYVMDQKTTGGSLGPYYFTQFNPDNQMSGYSLASKVIFNSPVVGVIIDAVQIAVGFTNFGRSITTRTDEQLNEWLQDFKVWTELEMRYADGGYWPMNDKSCHKYGGCPFRGVCGSDPRVRQQFLDTNFEVREWNPLQSRETVND